jgi:hypothetical protein
MSYKITDLTPKAAPLGATDLLETSVDLGGSYASKSVTGQNIKDYVGLGGEDYVFVDSKGTPEQNGSTLLAAYNTAKTMSPSISNVVTVLVAPGEYVFNQQFTLDTQYINLVSITGNRDVFLGRSDLADPFNFSNFRQPSSVFVNANNVYVKGIISKTYTSANYNSYWGSSVYMLPIIVNKNLGGIVLENCQGGPFSFGDPDLSSGININVSGTFLNCTGGVMSFAGDTLAGPGSGGTASGTFTNCVAGQYSFGSSGTASGIFNNCTAGSSGFATDGTASGTFTNCVAGTDSFGGSLSGALTGKLYYCRLTSGTFKTVSLSGITRYCLDGTNTPNNQG